MDLPARYEGEGNPMDLPARYEDDIYAWSQHQAAVLRRMAETPAALPNDLDIGNVAEEIETLGRSELHGVERHLMRMLEHVIKAVSSPTAYPATTWMEEVAREQGEAADGYRPSMRQNLDIEAIWRKAQRLAGVGLRAHGEQIAPLPENCPFALEEMLDLGILPEASVARLAALAAPSG
jgi:Domain of unknown function DUF29